MVMPCTDSCSGYLVYKQASLACASSMNMRGTQPGLARHAAAELLSLRTLCVRHMTARHRQKQILRALLETQNRSRTVLLYMHLSTARVWHIARNEDMHETRGSMLATVRHGGEAGAYRIQTKSGTSATWSCRQQTPAHVSSMRKWDHAPSWSRQCCDTASVVKYGTGMASLANSRALEPK